MNSQIRDVLEETRLLAAEHGWAEVSQLSTALLEGDGARGVIVGVVAEVDASSLTQWVRRALPQSEVRALELEELALNPMPAVQAGKIVAVFECGRLIEASAMEAVESALFGRPPESYAIVLVGAELVHSDEELETIQRGVWRLLVPDPKPEWAGQDLLQQGCFLWSDAQPRDFLSLRVERDKAAFERWLRAPATDEDALARDGALHILELAEAGVRRSGSGPLNDSPDSSGGAGEEHQISGALDSVSETRRRLLRRLDAGASLVERQLTASLQTLEQDLTLELPQHLKRVGHNDKDGDLNQVLNEFISGRMARWQLGAQDVLQARGREIAAEVEQMLAGLDWELVNRLAQRAGDSKRYPEAILRSMSAGTNATSAGASQSAAAPDLLNGSTQTSGAGSGGDALWAVPLAAVLLGPLGLVTVGVVGTVAGAVAAVMGARRANRAMDERRAEAYGRTAVHETTQRAIAFVRSSSQGVVAPARDGLGRELRALEEMLDRALSQARAAGQGHGAAPTSPEREKLEELRRRVLAIGQAPQAMWAPSS